MLFSVGNGPFISSLWMCPQITCIAIITSPITSYCIYLLVHLFPQQTVNFLRVRANVAHLGISIGWSGKKGVNMLLEALLRILQARYCLLPSPPLAVLLSLTSAASSVLQERSPTTGWLILLSWENVPVIEDYWWAGTWRFCLHTLPFRKYVLGLP